MPDLGKAYVQIVPSAQGISGSISSVLNKEAGNAGKNAGNSIISNIKKIIVGSGIGIALAKTITSSLSAGGELQQNLGGTEAVFGEFASQVQTTAQDAYKNMGLSASDYMATANKMASLFQGSGISQQESLNLTSDAMQRAADVASVMGVDTQSAMESIAGAAKGNFTMMDNLGVSMNATTLQAYALEKGINFDWNTATQAEKSELAMKMFMDRTSQYAGNFAKESTETLSGSLGAMKSAFTDVLGNLALGEDITPSLNNLTTTILGFTNNLMPAISSILTQLPTALVTIITGLLPTIVTTLVPTLMTAVSSLVMSLITGLITMVPTLIPQLVSAGLNVINGMLELVPQILLLAPQLIGALADGLLASIPVIIEAVPEIVNSLIATLLSLLPLLIQCGVQLLTSLVTNLPEIISAICDVLPDLVKSIINALIDNIPLIINTGVELLMALITNLPLIMTELALAMPGIITSLVQALGEGAQEFVDVGWNMLTGLGDGIANAVGSVINKAKEACGRILKSVKNFFGIKSPSKVFAGIGAYLDEGLANGIADNTKPVTDAMNDLTDITTGSLESRITLSTAYNDAELAKATKASVSVNGSNGSNTTNLGGVTINVYAKDNQNSQELAQEINNILVAQAQKETAVFA